MDDQLFLYLGISAFSLLLTWIVVDFVRLRRRVTSTDSEGIRLIFRERKYVAFAEIIVMCNLSIFMFYLGFLVYEIWMVGLLSQLRSVLLQIMSWTLVTAFAFYCKGKVVRGNYSWPLVLVSWWLLCCLYQLFSISIYIANRLLLEKSESTAILLEFFPCATFPEFASFPLSAFLCFASVSMNSSRALHELKLPLLSGGGGGEEKADTCCRDNFSSAGFWSRLTFRWLNPVFEEGRTQRLELHHVPSVPCLETAETAHALLQETLSRQKPELSPLPKAIINAVWRPLIINAAFAGINTLSSYLGPLLITNFVEFLSGKGSEFGNSSGYMLAFVFFFGKTMESMSQRHWYFGARQIGVRVRAALMVSIYNKSLMTKYSSTSSGKAINFLEVDVERIGEFFFYIHGIWMLPLQVSLALVILYRNLGLAASASAFLATVMVMVSNTPLAKSQEKLHSEIMEAKDSRIKATSEALKCMRILKLHSWESAYLDKLLKLREVERSRLKRYLYTCSAIAFLFWASPTLVSVVAFGVCILMKMPLTPGTVLSALATFRILQEPIYNLPELISMITQTKVSIDRVQDFIKEEKQQNPSKPKHISKASDVAVVIKSGKYSWDPNFGETKPTVKINKNLTVLRGQKVAVCGSIGAGKSSLLCSIMGEIPKVYGGRTKVFGRRAYVPQSAWIQTGTIRENVLFGKEMEKGLYEQVLVACALDKDVEQWMDGDMTVVGERGMNLSGGQKQRIQLARAIYSNSDVYLLDDPFSAVDAHTGAHLFKECLMGLLSSKTVIYTTHQLEFLDAADFVLVMRDGKIVQSGKYEDLIAETNGELKRQMAAHNQTLSQVTQSQGHGVSESKSQKMKETELREEDVNERTREAKPPERTLEEERESGRVKWHVYRTFVTCAYKGALVPVVLVCQILFLVLQMGSNYWMAWATEKEDRGVSREKLIGVFMVMSLCSSLFILGRAVLLSTIALETSQRLFHRMTTSIFRAPMFFFDSTPASRILNRSSTDQTTLDTDIPYRLAGLVFALVQLLGIIFLMSQAAWPVFILFIIVLAISVWYQTYYISSARELARMVGIRKAPILHHFSESIAGAPTIRCFNQEDRFSAKNHALIDDYSRVTFHNSATMEWLCVRINFLFNLVFFLLLVILVTMPRDSIDPSLAGLAATYGLNLNVLQAWVIWNLCNVENKMICVERILQFCNITSEASPVIENCRPEEDWPKCGTIELENLHVQYSPGLPMVLKGINCTFPGEKKIGVVGRTGSGKSTLIQALFRVVEPSSGRIMIDGLDISKMGLHDLRTKLSIIPQEPTLFQGTIRTNLDPLQHHSDVEIWEALHKCRLAKIVKQDQRLLDAPVAEGGENWSVGQRQLVCLARVLLKKRRILVLDEATASVDTATDNFIQKNIREEASNCTVITVAHRIATVIDSDLVLVLDKGRILEFKSPGDLLRDELSAFSKLVTEFLGRSRSNDGSKLN